jgi:hypothetical protein
MAKGIIKTLPGSKKFFQPPADFKNRLMKKVPGVFQAHFDILNDGGATTSLESAITFTVTKDVRIKSLLLQGFKETGAGVRSLIPLMNMNVFPNANAYKPFVPIGTMTGIDEPDQYLNYVCENYYNANQTPEITSEFIIRAGTANTILVRAYESFALNDYFIAVATLKFEDE